MATYVPNATDLTQPTTDKFVESAAAEFRALKALAKNINDRLGYIETTGGVGGGSSKAQIIGLITNKDPVDVASYNTDPNQAIFKFDCTAPWSGDVFKDSMMILRNADYSGGGDDSSGNRNSGYGLYVQTTSSTNASNNECGIRGVIVNNSVVDPSATALGQAWPQQIAVAGNAFQMLGANSPVWGGWFSAHNFSGVPQVAGRGALCGIEVNVGLNGTDAYSSTIGVMAIPLVVGSGGVCKGWTAFWASSSGNTDICWQFGFTAQDSAYASFYSRGIGIRCLHATGTYVVGLDLGDATCTTGLRLARGQKIAFDKNDDYYMKLNSASGLLEFFRQSTRRGYINLDSGADSDLASGAGGGGDAYVGGINAFTNVNYFQNSTYLGADPSFNAIAGTSTYLGYTVMCGNFNLQNNALWVGTANLRVTNTSSPKGYQVRFLLPDFTYGWATLYN